MLEKNGRPSVKESLPENRRDTDPFTLVLKELGEMGDFVAHLAHVKVDEARVRVRTAWVHAMTALLLTVMVITAVTTAVIYLIRGVALAAAAFAGDRLWVGYLTAGAVCLVGIASAATLYSWRTRAGRQRKLEAKYELRKRKQRVRHGRDVEQVAHATD